MQASTNQSSVEGKFDLSKKVNSFKEMISNVLQGNRQIAALALIAITVAIVIVIGMWSHNESYHPLYGQQEKFDSSQVINALDASGINYRIDPNTGQVLVPDNMLGQARMLLAAKGVKAKLPSGMELLDNMSLGTSQFIEHAKYRQSLEGELDRSIMSLDAVNQARVHLAIPKQTLFIRPDNEKTTASVLLELRPNTKLTPEQVSAVANLVSGSVNGLEPDQVKIVDQFGHLLSSEMSGALKLNNNTNKQLSVTHEIEQTLISRAKNMLTPILGENNFQVQIAANVNFDQIEETKESLDPNAVVRSETSNIDESKGMQAKGVPGTLSNRPASKDKQTQDVVSHRQNNKTFDVGRSVKHTQYQSMILSKLSVSVLLNSAIAGKKGWSKEELNDFTKMVEDSIGFDSARGDKFTISSFKFISPEEVKIEELPWWQQVNSISYLRYLISIILGLLLIFVVLRPLVKQLTQTGNEEQSPGRIKGKLSAIKNQIKRQPKESEETVESTSEQTITAPVKKDKAELEAELSYDSMSLDVKKKHIGKLAKEDPARVAEVISHWIRERDSE